MKIQENLGILVCLNGEVNAASEVTKIYSDSSLKHSRVWILEHLDLYKREELFSIAYQDIWKLFNTDKINTNVDLLTVYAGMDEKFFKFSADSRC